MKKLLLVLMFVLLLPIPAFAGKIVGSNIESSSSTSYNQGDEFTVNVKIKLDGFGFIEQYMLTGIAFELIYDNNALVVESISADNFQTILGKEDGKIVIAALIDTNKMIVSDNTCTNNIFCNTFVAKIKMFAKGSGSTQIQVGEVEVASASLDNDGNFTEDDIDTLEYKINSNILRVEINKVNGDIVAPTENIQSTPPSIKKEVPKVTVPKTTKATTTKPTTTASTEVPTTSAPTETTTENKQEKDEIKEDQEKRKKINKKIISYVITGLIIIILLVIANAIINKIRNRKIDKMLKKF